MSTAEASAGAAAAAAIAQANRAMGVIVEVDPDDWLVLVDLNDEPIAVHAVGGFFTTQHKYLTSYRGLAFITKSARPLNLPAHCQVVESPRIWAPGM